MTTSTKKVKKKQWIEINNTVYKNGLMAKTNYNIMKLFTYIIG